MQIRNFGLAFAILRENPTVVASGTAPSAREIHLGEKLDTSRTREEKTLRTAAQGCTR